MGVRCSLQASEFLDERSENEIVGCSSPKASYEDARCDFCGA